MWAASRAGRQSCSRDGWIRPNATELAGTEGAMNPFFSRDGQWVGFWTGKEISKVPVDGGGAVLLGEFGHHDRRELGRRGQPRHRDWRSLVHRCAAAAPRREARRRPMLELASGEIFHTDPQILPGGKAMLFRRSGRRPGQDNSTVDVVSHRRSQPQDTRARSRVCLATCRVAISFTRDKATMFAVPFDLERLETRGTAVEVLDDVAYDSVANMAQYDVSRTGTLVYRQKPVGHPMSTVQWVDPTGKQEPLARQARRLRRDAPRVARWQAHRDRHSRMAPIRTSGSTSRSATAMTRLTFGGGIFANPVWTRDGQHVVFGALGSGLYWSRADGAGQPQVLQAGKIEYPPSDGSHARRHAARVLPAGRQSANLDRSD